MTKSRIRRRSGSAVCSYCYYLDWKPDLIVQAGVGVWHAETVVFKEHWPDVRLIGFDPVEPAEPYPGDFFQYALGAKAGEADFWYKRGHSDGSSLHEIEGAEKRRIKVLPLDNVTPAEHTMLWLDCEGWETQVIRGGRRFLEGVEVINVEMTGMTPDSSKERWASPHHIHQELKEFNFYHAWTHTTRARGGQFDAIYVREHLFQPQRCSNPEEVWRWSLNRMTIG